MPLACLMTITIGFLIAYPLTWLMRAVAVWTGQMDAPGERKIHDRPIPVTGGVAMFWAIVAPIVVLMAGAWWAADEWWGRLLPEAVDHLPGARAQTGMAIALVGCLAALHITGLIDDRKNLGPFGKLLVQVMAAGVLVIGFDVRLFEWWGLAPSIALTILWFVIVTNAFNFLDNMDGLSAGVATICASILLAVALLGGQWFVAALLGLAVGAMLGFLVFNFPPASIFMGDGGSLVIGFLIAFCSVRITYYAPSVGEAFGGRGWWVVFTPLVVLAIPLYDLTSVTIIRLLQGKSPFKGDTQHFSHRLVKRGLTRPAAVIVIYACTLATGIGGVMLGRLTEAWQAALVIVQTLAVLLVLALLERATNHLGKRE